MRCPTCDSQVDRPQEVCPHCGTVLGWGAPPQPPPPPPPPGGPQPGSISPDLLAAYVGPKAAFYLPRFKRFFDRDDGFATTWNWSAFFFTFWWLLYRKMYLWAVLCFALSMFFSPGHLVLMIVCGFLGNYLYYRQARQQVIDAGRLYETRDPLAALAARGGVHRWVPWVAVAATLLLIILWVGFFGTVFMLGLWGHHGGGY